MPIFECSRCNDLTYSSSTDERRCLRRVRRRAQAAGPRRDDVRRGEGAPARDVPRRPLDRGLRRLRAGRADRHAVRRPGDARRRPRHGRGAPGARGPRPRAAASRRPPRHLLGAAERHLRADVLARRASSTASSRSPRTSTGRCSSSAARTSRSRRFTSREDWIDYERLAHETAVEYGMTVLCLYDARIHDDVHAARRA